MIEIEVKFPAQAKLTGAERLIERACKAEGLATTLKGTLAKYPGCIHWHFKKGRERGTLEITLWKEKRRIWLTVSAGRKGKWINEAAPRLKRSIEIKL